MTKAIKTIDKTVNGFLGAVVVVMLSVLSVIVFAQVLFRLGHASIKWSEEVSKYLLVWTTFLGSALCVRKGSLIGLEIIFMVLPKKAEKPVTLLIEAITSLFLIFLIKQGFQTTMVVARQITPVLKLSMGLMYVAIPIGGVFMLLNTFIVAYYKITGTGN